MVERFLCTTALEETWCDDRPLLFLGEWCKLYSRKAHWSQLDAETLSYHWDDRAKLYEDYRYLREFNERLLVDLTSQLNAMHQVDHSLRYWRIVIGPWLGWFIQILFDRWTSIQNAISSYSLSGTTILSAAAQAMTPLNMGHFQSLALTDRWNHFIYAAILRAVSNIPFCELNEKQETSKEHKFSVISKKNVRQSFTAACSKAAGMFARKKDYFLFATYLSVKNEMEIHLRLGQIPQFWRVVSPVQVAAEMARRQWVVQGVNRSEFEAFARSVIPQQIPTAYLEGYRALVEQSASVDWPSEARVIWTSNSHTSDEVFKVWTAERVERGARLVIGQHGGHFGTGLWSFYEDHDTAISDRYMSWGWNDAARSNVHPVGQLNATQSLKVKRAAKTKALLVTCAFPRYSYWMYSSLVARQWLDYFDEQCRFVGQLPSHIQDALIVRAYPEDYGWSQVDRWRDRFPNLKVDQGRLKIDQLIRRSRLYISTYNATTFLESFTMNVPTVIYWKKCHWELRDSAIPYFEELCRVGIFHDTPESAAHHVAAIWDDVESWWHRPDVTEVLERFKQHYCRRPEDLVLSVKRALVETVTDPNNTRTS